MKARVIAFYLPQFHPIPENEKVWGKGFTEWTNVASAKPLFRGHKQPRIPADLGFYDLRMPSVREEQAQMAREAGVEGFAYWHYWMGGGKRLLGLPIDEVLATHHPDFPFCFAWANHDWRTGSWKHGGGNQMICPQLYPGPDDYKLHFEFCLKAFRDPRYITVDGKPLFLLYDPYNFPDVGRFIETWRTLAHEAGLPGLHLVAMGNATSTVRRRPDGTTYRVMPDPTSSANVYNDFIHLGFDAVNPFGKPRAEMLYEGRNMHLVLAFLRKYFDFLPARKFDYARVMPHFFPPEDAWENVYPSIMPQWDRSPRCGVADGIYVNATPETFERHVRHALQLIKDKQPEHRILFLRAWNEWAEGNYVEPDTTYGRGFLDALARALTGQE